MVGPHPQVRCLVHCGPWCESNLGQMRDISAMHIRGLFGLLFNILFMSIVICTYLPTLTSISLNHVGLISLRAARSVDYILVV